MTYFQETPRQIGREKRRTLLRQNYYFIEMFINSSSQTEKKQIFNFSPRQEILKNHTACDYFFRSRECAELSAKKQFSFLNILIIFIAYEKALIVY